MINVKIPDFDLSKLKKLLNRRQKNAYVKAGILEGTKNDETGEDVAAYAIANEYGTSEIPSRPFMRTTYNKRVTAWKDFLRSELSGGRDNADALALTGELMKSDIQGTITSNMPPANSPATIEAKTRKVGSGGTMHTGTLIDTGTLLKSIDYEVKENA